MFFTEKQRKYIDSLEHRITRLESNPARNVDESKFYSYVSHLDAGIRSQIKERDLKIEELEKQVKTMQEHWQEFLKQLTLKTIRGE